MRPGRPRIAKAWQRLLIDNGYAARTIPKAYGGFGAEPDGLKARIIAEEFIEAGAPRGMSGPGHLDAGADPAGGGHRGAEDQLDPADPERRDHLVPGLFGTGLGSDLANAADQGGRGRRAISSSAARKSGQARRRRREMMFCLVRTEPDKPKHEGISYILFPMNTPGIEVRPLEDHDRPGRVQRGVLHRRARAEEPMWSAARGRGWYVANTTLKHERGMLGDPERATEARLKCGIGHDTRLRRTGCNPLPYKLRWYWHSTPRSPAACAHRVRP